MTPMGPRHQVVLFTWTEGIAGSDFSILILSHLLSPLRIADWTKKFDKIRAIRQNSFMFRYGITIAVLRSVLMQADH
jgi:hypothetical protein